MTPGGKFTPAAVPACLQHGTHRRDCGPAWLLWSFGSSPGAGADSINLSLALLFRGLKGGLQTLFKTTGSYRSTLSYIQRTTPSGYFGLTTCLLSSVITSLCQEIAMEGLQVEGTQPTPQWRSVLGAQASAALGLLSLHLWLSPTCTLRHP